MTIQQAEARRLSHLREFAVGDTDFVTPLLELDDTWITCADRPASLELQEAIAALGREAGKHPTNEDFLDAHSPEHDDR